MYLNFHARSGGSVSHDNHTMSDLSVRLLTKQLRSITNWYNFGLFLNMSPDELNAISCDHQSEGVERCKTALFDKWLKGNPDATWEQVAIALDELGERVLAAEIRKSSPTVEEDSASMKGQVDPPVVDVKLERTDVEKFTSLQQTFDSIVYELHDELEKKVPLTSLQRYLSICLERPVAPKANRIDEVFHEIQPEYSFLNTSLLVSLVLRFLGESQLKGKLQKYQKSLEKYTEKTKVFIIKQVQLKAPPMPIPPNKPQVHLKLSAILYGVTIKRFQQLVRYIFANNKANVFSHIHVKDGCISVSWLIHESAISSLVSSAQENIELLRLIGVLQLVVGNNCIMKEEEDKNASLEDALYHASSSTCVEAVKFLLRPGADPNTSRNVSTPLIAACEIGSFSTAEILLDRDADPNIQNISGETTLIKAILSKNAALVKLLLNSGTDVNLQTNKGITALMLAAANGYTEMALQLLMEGAVVDMRSRKGLTALMFAIYGNHLDVCAMLLIKGANPNIQDSTSGTALMCACWKQHVKAVKLLLANGADPNIQDCEGFTALLTSCNYSVDPSILTLLLLAGADPNIPSYDCRTPLMIAASNCYQAGVKLLLNAKVDVNIKDDYGYTALHYSTQVGHYSITQLLIVAGAHTSLKNNYHKTAIDIAIAGGHDAICQLILAHLDIEPSTHFPETQAILQDVDELVSKYKHYMYY